MTISAIASHVSATGMVGNPKRVRGPDASMLIEPKPAESTLVGNPRRTRGLQAADFQAA